MKSIQSFQKIFFIALFGIICMVQQSCKKADMQPHSISVNASSNETHANSTLAFLKTKGNATNQVRTAFIANVVKNLEFGKMYSESLHQTETLIVVPLKDEYFSAHIQGTHPKQYLLVAQDEQGKIRRAEVAMFYSADPNATELPKKALETFFTKQQLNVDGKILLVNLGDIKQFEATFAGGKLTKFAKMQKTDGQNLENCLA